MENCFAPIKIALTSGNISRLSPLLAGYLEPGKQTSRSEPFEHYPQGLSLSTGAI
jgi:hypothetical protein